MAASLLMTSVHRVQAQSSVALDVNGDGVSEFLNRTSTSSFPKDTGVAAFVSPQDSVHPENAILAMGVGGTVGATTPWEPGAISTSAGKLKVRWNTNASDLAGGLRIQKRSLQPGSSWTTVQTVGTGFEVEVGLSGEAAIYRVVK